MSKLLMTIFRNKMMIRKNILKKSNRSMHIIHCIDAYTNNIAY